MAVCPKCGSGMEPGFIPDLSHGNRVLRATWIRGEAQWKFFGGFKAPRRERKKHPISALRCTRCGFIELYVKDTAL